MSIKLKNIVTIAKGKKQNIVDVPSDTSRRLISINDLRNDENIVFTNDKKGTDARENDVLIAWDGANAGTIGFGKNGFIGSTIARLRFKEPDKYNAQFVGAYLRTKFDYLRKTATGATIPHISRPALESISIPEFEIDDQIRIAKLLSRIEALIATRNTNLQQLDDFIKNTFLEMFEIVSGNYKKWKIDKLVNHSEIVSGVTKGKKYTSQQLLNAPYMRVANVQDGYLELRDIKTIEVTQKEIEKYKLIDGDVLLTEGGDPDKLGRGCVWENQIENCIHQNHIFRVRVENKVELNPYYLSGLVGSVYGKAYFLKSAKQTTGIASINSTQLKKFPLIIPPKTMQDEFSSLYTLVEALKIKYADNLTELENLYGALSQKAFKGELDLSRVPLPEVAPTVHERTLTDQIPVTDEVHVFEYPMSVPEERSKLLRGLFQDYLKEHKDRKLELEDFWQQANLKTIDMMDEFDKHWNADDYDQVKDWLFELIREGKIDQELVMDTSVSPAEGQIELKVKG